MRSLRMQLLASHMLLVLLMGFVMGGAILAFFQIGRSIDRVLEDNFQTVLAAGRFQTALSEQESALGLLSAGEGGEAAERFRQATIEATNALRSMEQSVEEEQEASLVARIQLDYESYLASAMRAVTANELSLQPGTVDFVRDMLRPRIQKLERDAEQVQRLNEQEIRESNRIAQERAREYFIRSLAVTAVALLLAVLLALRMVRMALTPLAILSRHAEKIAQGELDQQVTVPRSDEIGALADSFNEMAKKLAEVRRSEVRRLQRAQQMSDAALESLYDPVVITDARSRIVHLNRAAEGLFGAVRTSPRAPLSEHIRDRRIVSAIDKAIHEGHVSTGEEEGALVPIRVGESERTYRLRATPMKDDAGNLLGSVAVLEDITHLREVDRLKTEFIGVASHELRTPVTSLMLSVQLLLEGAAGPLSEAQQQIVQAQKEDLERLEKLMRDLLDVTRLEAGSSPPRFERVTPEELLKSPVAGLKSQAIKKGVELRAEVDPDLGWVRADRIQIGRVLTNLISNAIRHTRGGGVVCVRATATPDEVTFSVADTGEGIPGEYLGKIFERFTQVPGATQGGAGLGLSIADGIVRSHGGSMSVESEVGKGSTFRFTLPREGAPEGKERIG